MRNWPESRTKLKKIHNPRDQRNPEFCKEQRNSTKNTVK